MRMDSSGRYVAIYRRWHLIGLEVGVSVASAALRGEATGAPICFNADVVATAKRDLRPGEMLDGEGGYTVYGKISPAERSLAVNMLYALMLIRYRNYRGSLTHAAFLSARNDTLANMAIIATGLVTAFVWRSAWPDLIVGIGIAAMNAGAAREVWSAARDEARAAE